MQELRQRTDLLRTGVLAAVTLGLALVACAGIIYCAYWGSLLGVIAAALVPGFVVAWVLEPAQMAKLRGPDKGR